jgi:uncharacterized membrane-anchored protein YitT (DUF2179 family)
MKTNDYGFTLVDGEGNQERVKILFSVIKRKNLPLLLNAVSRYNPDSFYSVENVKTAGNGIFPRVGDTVFSRLFRLHRKSK